MSLLLILCGSLCNSLYGQAFLFPDSLKYNILDDCFFYLQQKKPSILQFLPKNIFQRISYDPTTNYYILHTHIGNRLLRPPFILSLQELQKHWFKIEDRKYWEKLSTANQSKEPSYSSNFIHHQTPTFTKLFGSNHITIIPKGSIDLSLAGQYNRRANPLLSDKNRKQWAMNIDPTINLNLDVKIGERSTLQAIINSKHQFDFENKLHFEYQGKEDAILRKVEIGNVSLPLQTNLIQGAESLFGLSTQVQIGPLTLKGILAQKKSLTKQIILNQGIQEVQIDISASAYEANQHFFLAQYFRNNYNHFLAGATFINSPIHITKIEVWVSNTSTYSVDNRDILALLDLGESNPHNPLLNSNPTFSLPSSGIPGIPNGVISNNLSILLANDSRIEGETNTAALFGETGAILNYAKVSSARKLIEDQEYTVNKKLGFISLLTPMNENQVLAVSYRYTAYGQEYQVGEFSADLPQTENISTMLYTKLLKNKQIKTSDPTWSLMMKNIYRLPAAEIEELNFNLQIVRKDPGTGIESPSFNKGIDSENSSWLALTHLDRLTQNNTMGSDGQFDWLPGITIDKKNGRIFFPLLEPFGKDLAQSINNLKKENLEEYTFNELYTHLPYDVERNFSHKNSFRIKGKLSIGQTNEFYLGRINLKPASVHIQSGGIALKEQLDYTIDYTIGLLQITNPTILLAGQPIVIHIEDETYFGSQSKTIMGGRVDYEVNPKLNIGGTFLRYTEKPILQKITIGSEAVANSIYGFDLNYHSSPTWLNKLTAKITKSTPSTLTFYGEFAKLNPSYLSTKYNQKGDKGMSYIDDFENAFTPIDIKTQHGWQISATPQHFPESALSNDLAYGYRRALLACYTIDPSFYYPTAQQQKISNTSFSDDRTRRITEQEIFPAKDSKNGIAQHLPTLDIAYYPMVRGPYNYTTDIESNGNLSNPTKNWAGIFKKISASDFESHNINHLEMWIMDPTLTSADKAGGDLYFNLGNVSEDILKDGRKSLENGLSPTGNNSASDHTVWGKVVKLQPTIHSFENSSEGRTHQDIGLDGLTNEEERLSHASFLNTVAAIVDPTTFEKIREDPSTDDYIHFRGKQFNQSSGILERYKFINGTQGNSRTSQQSKEDFGIDFSARTLLPDGEDIDGDNHMNQLEEYYQYRFSTRPKDLIVGKNHIVEERLTTVSIDAKSRTIRWLKISIPLENFESRIGQIQNLKNINFIRIFLSNYQDTVVLRFAKLQFIKSEWQKYNPDNHMSKVIRNPLLGNVSTDNSTFTLSNINIEENGSRQPIPYVSPPGIERQVQYNINNLDTKDNEQALSIQLKNLKDGYGRAVIKFVQQDIRAYNNIEMYTHAEGENLSDGDATCFIRLGTDDEYNYYEFEQPLITTAYGSVTPEMIWPEQNKIALRLKNLVEAKIAREKEIINGNPWPKELPYECLIDNQRITIIGNPDLSDVRFYMIGIKNPLQKTAFSSSKDTGEPISGEFWFNELRVTGFNEKGGWAAIARVNIQLADFANIAITTRKSTIGFGTLFQRIGERNKTNHFMYDIAANVDAGKLLAPKPKYQIPIFINFNQHINTPEYNPFHPDIKLNDALSRLDTKNQKILLKQVQEVSTRKSFNLINFQKLKNADKDNSKPWDIENLSLSLYFNEIKQRNFSTQSFLRREYNTVLAYNYYNSNQNFKQPFEKIKSVNALIFRDFTYNLVPSLLTFKLSVNRIYQENTFRENSTDNSLPTYYSKNFNMTRLYGISWDLTKSIRLDFNATNYSIIDEPNGRIDGIKIDTLWQNFLKLGRTTDYNHMLNIVYQLPLNKLHFLEWINVSARYGTNFNWQSEPFNTRNRENINLGNSIQNNRTIQINPTLNFNMFYNSFQFIRNNRDHDSGGLKPFLTQLLTSIRHTNIAYTKTTGLFLPGYLPKTNLIGYDFDYDAPGISFLFGSQSSIINKAITKKWLTKDSLQNKQVTQTFTENIAGIVNMQPIKNMRIDLSFSKTHNYNKSSQITHNPQTDQFQMLPAFTNGNYSISQIALRTSFRKTNRIMEIFHQSKQEISQTLAKNNINSVGITKEQFADGYDKNQQDVNINAFLDTYTTKKTATGNRKPIFPLPNWRVNYSGMIALLALEDLIQSIFITHSYHSLYIINTYSTNSLHKEDNNVVYTRDNTGNFTSLFNYGAVTITDRSFPLIGIDVRFKKNLSLNTELRKAREANLSMINSQTVFSEEQSYSFALAYRKRSINLPFGWYKYNKWQNDINFKIEIAYNDRKTTVFRADNINGEIAVGNKSITLNPTLDLTVNNRYTLRIFYNSNHVQPYTSETFATAYTYFGINFKIHFH